MPKFKARTRKCHSDMLFVKVKLDPRTLQSTLLSNVFSNIYYHWKVKVHWMDKYSISFKRSSPFLLLVSLWMFWCIEKCICTLTSKNRVLILTYRSTYNVIMYVEILMKFLGIIYHEMYNTVSRDYLPLNRQPLRIKLRLVPSSLGLRNKIPYNRNGDMV